MPALIRVSVSVDVIALIIILITVFMINANFSAEPYVLIRKSRPLPNIASDFRFFLC